MIKLIKEFIVTIVINGAILYLVNKYIPELGFSIRASQYDVFVTFGVLGFMFWIINSLIKRVIKIVTIPIKYLTLGISSIVINVLMFYLFALVVNGMKLGIIVHLGTIAQVFVMSLVITVLSLLLKKIL